MDKNKSNNLGVFMHPSDYNCPFHSLFMNFSTQIIACCAYRCSYRRFSYPFLPRAESATFLFATMLISRITTRTIACYVNLGSFIRTSHATICCTFMTPKRRFWKEEQKMTCGFSKNFSTVRGPNWVLTPLKSARKSACHLLFLLPKSSFGRGNFRVKVSTEARKGHERVDKKTR